MAVLAGRQAEENPDTSHVDIGSAPSLGGVVQEEVLLQVLLVAVHLRRKSPRCLQPLGRDGPPHSPPQGVLLPNSLVTHFIVTTYQLPMPKASNSSNIPAAPYPISSSFSAVIQK